MTKITSSMRLKVKRDTFFLPDHNMGVYFRNNLSSFRMEGSSVEKWVEKLIPMLNGELTMGDLTEGLPGPYRNRVYEIADVLFRNGFARDVSKDRPHSLTPEVQKKHASQIEFIESFVDSGAYRFQVYRQAKVLAIGSGPFFVSLVTALMESGLSNVHVLITDNVPTNRLRLEELVTHVQRTDPDVTVVEIDAQKTGARSWEEIIHPFESILYVQQEGEIEELRNLHAVCREEMKVFLPAICLDQIGWAGPLVHPKSTGCWESAWRRLHQSSLGKDRHLASYATTAGAILANVIQFELFKHITGVSELDQNNQFYLLDLETLEGNWHYFLPHPLVNGHLSAKWVEEFDQRLEPGLNKEQQSELLLFFNKLTSENSGIFHVWEEEDLKQLPLAQCSVQAVDPLTNGPAELLPSIVCSGMTHVEARREAGLIGVEAYVTRMIDLLVTALPPNQDVKGGISERQEFIGVGAGETFAEGVCRGLQRCLTEEFKNHSHNQKRFASRIQLSAIEDEHCQYYLQALTTMQGEPTIGIGEEVLGFPVIWLNTNGNWYGGVGVNMTIALRNVLSQALMEEQNQAACPSSHIIENSQVILEGMVHPSLTVPSREKTTYSEILISARENLERNKKRLLVFEVELEAILKEGLAGVFGVLLREGESL